jgi:vacuolar-type H+-ATPase subunit E/Vma4
MSNDWRNDPATEKQKEKLRFFGCTWEEGITKGQASDAIDECVKMFPEKEKEYQNRPATEAQMKEIRAYLEAYGETIEDYAESGETLT